MQAPPGCGAGTGAYLLPDEAAPLHLLQGLHRSMALPALPPPRIRLRPTEYANLSVTHARWTHHGRHAAGERRARQALPPPQGSAARASCAVCQDARREPRADSLHGRRNRKGVIRGTVTHLATEPLLFRVGGCNDLQLLSSHCCRVVTSRSRLRCMHRSAVPLVAPAAASAASRAPCLRGDS